MICDTPERIPARIYRRALERSDGCPCCAFWFGVVVSCAGCALVGLAVYIAL